MHAYRKEKKNETRQLCCKNIKSENFGKNIKKNLDTLFPICMKVKCVYYLQ